MIESAHTAVYGCAVELARLFDTDETGYIRITTAAECRIASHRITVGAARVALPTSALRGRKRVYVKNNEQFDDPGQRQGHPLLYVGAADVLADVLPPMLIRRNGFIIPAGDELMLDITDGLVLYGVASDGESVDTGILELA